MWTRGSRPEGTRKRGLEDDVADELSALRPGGEEIKRGHVTVTGECVTNNGRKKSYDSGDGQWEDGEGESASGCWDAGR